MPFREQKMPLKGTPWTKALKAQRIIRDRPPLQSVHPLEWFWKSQPSRQEARQRWTGP